MYKAPRFCFVAVSAVQSKVIPTVLYGTIDKLYEPLVDIALDARKVTNLNIAHEVLVF